MRNLSPLVLCLGLACVLTPLGERRGAAQGATEYEKALAFYEERIRRPPLSTRLGGMGRLARTKDPRALEILGKRYAKPRDPKDHERYLIAALIGRQFTTREHVEPIWKLLGKYKQAEHAWLWTNALGAAARQPDATAVLEAVLDDKLDPLLRAAALEALAAQRHRQGLSAVLQLCGEKLPRKGTARSALLKSCASVLRRHRESAQTPLFKQAAGAVIDLLKRDDVAERTKLVIVRYLASVYETEKASLDHGYWRRVMHFDPDASPDEPTVVARPRFYGVEAVGKRVAYLLDLSDSMLEPLTPHEIADARAAEAELAPPAEGEEGPEPLDWSKIRNRFQLARAYLVRSLSALDPKTEFVVIGFGDRVRATKGLVRASRGAVKGAIRELEDMKIGRTTPKRPYGTLRGATNPHAALLQAFRALPRKSIRNYEHVDEKGLALGCDTVFVFSDGKPTKDDFAANDEFHGGRMTIDTETGETEERARGSASYGGPYKGTRHLLEDLRRMNVFRKAEIHTVAIGEADNTFMRRMAEEGLGQYRSIGMLGRGGRINAWWLVGPFPAKEVEDWDRKEAPEDGVDLKRPLAIGEESVRWKRVFAQPRTGVVDLNPQFEPRDHVAAYAYAEIRVANAREARLLVGSDDGVRVWVNGQLVHTKLEKRGLPMKKRAVVEAELDRVDVRLKAGTNRILLKVCDHRGPWRFCARLTDPSGGPLPFLMR